MGRPPPPPSFGQCPKENVFLLLMSSLNGKSLCPKKLGGKGGTPPPLAENCRKFSSKNGSKRARLGVLLAKFFFNGIGGYFPPPLREDINRKKTCSFGHCPNHLNPPPMTPIQATWSSFLDVKNDVLRV